MKLQNIIKKQFIIIEMSSNQRSFSPFIRSVPAWVGTASANEGVASQTSRALGRDIEAGLARSASSCGCANASSIKTYGLATSLTIESLGGSSLKAVTGVAGCAVYRNVSVGIGAGGTNISSGACAAPGTRDNAAAIIGEHISWWTFGTEGSSGLQGVNASQAVKIGIAIASGVRAIFLAQGTGVVVSVTTVALTTVFCDIGVRVSAAGAFAWCSTIAGALRWARLGSANFGGPVIIVAFIALTLPARVCIRVSARGTNTWSGASTSTDRRAWLFLTLSRSWVVEIPSLARWASSGQVPVCVEATWTDISSHFTLAKSWASSCSKSNAFIGGHVNLVSGDASNAISSRIFKGVDTSWTCSRVGSTCTTIRAARRATFTFIMFTVSFGFSMSTRSFIVVGINCNNQQDEWNYADIFVHDINTPNS